MNEQPIISVRGEALLEVEPEVAIVNIEMIEARDRDRGGRCSACGPVGIST